MVKAKPVAMKKSVCTNVLVTCPDTAPMSVPMLLMVCITPTDTRQPYTLRLPMAMITVHASTSKHCWPKRSSVPDVFANVPLNDSGVVKKPAITISTDRVNSVSSRLFPQVKSKNSSSATKSGVLSSSVGGAPATSLNVSANPDAAANSSMHTNTPWNIGKNAVGSVSFKSSTESPARVMLSTRAAGFAAHRATATWMAPMAIVAFKGVPNTALNRSSTLKMNRPSAMAKPTCLFDSSCTRHSANRQSVRARPMERAKMPRDPSATLWVASPPATSATAANENAQASATVPRAFITCGLR